MRKILILITGCLLVCLGILKWGGLELEKAKITMTGIFYEEINRLMFPYTYLYDISGKELFLQDAERLWLPTIITYSASVTYQGTEEWNTEGQGSKPPVEMPNTESMTDVSVGTQNSSTEGDVSKDTEAQAPEQNLETESQAPEKNPNTETTAPLGLVKKVEINRTKLQDFDYLRQNFYQVDNTTTIGSSLLDVKKMLEQDMTLSEGKGKPQILIYHTHSQEAYKDSKSGDASTSIVGVGDHLEEILESKYGIEVLHHKGKYDVPSRDNAYSQALPNIEKILKENPSIEVVIDLHRDAVPDSMHLVTEINGKKTAKIMFFNGLSRTTAKGELTYLPNKNLEDNLAFSFQMQLAAAEYYPGLTRKIYLKGYRYNMHLLPKSLLIEVGAQNNTFAEAKNAMEPLAALLALVLKGGA